jgi:hypothetical protein
MEELKNIELRPRIAEALEDGIKNAIVTFYLFIFYVFSILFFL